MSPQQQEEPEQKPERKRRRNVGRTVRLWLGPVATATYWVARMLREFAGWTWRRILEWLDRLM